MELWRDRSPVNVVEADAGDLLADGYPFAWVTLKLLLKATVLYYCVSLGSAMFSIL